jgi:excisionase family DNA binding protein
MSEPGTGDGELGVDGGAEDRREGGAADPGRGRPVPIGEAARRLGVSTTTLRAWDREGLLRPWRTLGGHRRYAPADLERARANGEPTAKG